MTNFDRDLLPSFPVPPGGLEDVRRRAQRISTRDQWRRVMASVATSAAAVVLVVLGLTSTGWISDGPLTDGNQEASVTATMGRDESSFRAPALGADAPAATTIEGTDETSTLPLALPLLGVGLLGLLTSLVVTARRLHRSSLIERKLPRSLLFAVALSAALIGLGIFLLWA